MIKQLKKDWDNDEVWKRRYPIKPMGKVEKFIWFWIGFSMFSTAVRMLTP